MKSKLIIIGLIFILSWSFVTVEVQAWEREDKQRVIIPNLTFSRITESTGWRLDENGIWQERENIIPEKPDSSQRRAIGTDNFSEMKFRPVKVEGEDFLVFVKIQTRGNYRYPNIYRGWITYDYICFYLIDWSVFHKIEFEFPVGEPVLLEIPAIRSGKGRAIITTLSDILIDTLTKEPDPLERDHTLYIHYLVLDEGVTRFNIFGGSQSKIIGGYECLESIAGGRIPSIEDKNGKLHRRIAAFKHPDIFHKAYFETETETFKNFLVWDKNK